MAATKTQDLGYWISMKNYGEIISRPYTYEEIVKLKTQESIKIIDIFKIDTDREGRVHFQRLDSLMEL